jgi:NarL family two-component system response regulator LiaR
MLRVLICDDQEVVCEGLRFILGTVEEIDVVGVAANGAEALAAIPSLQPELVLMDLKMPVMNGVQATRQIRALHAHVRVLVLTTYDADEWVFDAIRAGASGYLLKDSPREELIAAIKTTVEGGTVVDPQVAGKLFSYVAQKPESGPSSASPLGQDQAKQLLAELSEREREILALLAQGLPNNEIARGLHLSEGTVRNYLSTIFLKLDVTDRTQAAILALRLGLDRSSAV